MESLKPLLLLVVLGGVAYCVYVALNQAPPPELATLATEWNKLPASSPNGVAGNRPADTAPMGSVPQAMGQQGAFGGGNSPNMPQPNDSAAVPSGGYNSGQAGSAMNSLPFGLGASAARTAVSNSSPQSQMSAPAGNLPETQPLDRYGTAAGNSVMPGAGAMNSGAPAASAPNFGATNSGDANSAIPNQNSAKQIADAQARHDYEASTRTAMTLLNQGQLVEALRELSRWYGQAVVPPEDEPRLVALLGQLAGTVIYSRDPWLGPPYQVRAGDSVESIAQQYQVPWQLLAKINGIQNPNGLLPGEKLKIVHGPFQAQLNVRQGWLALFVDGLYAGRFPVQVAGSLVKPDGAYPVAKFTGDAAGATSSRAPYISLGGDLHLRVPDDALPPGVNAVRISRQDMNDVFDMLSDRSQVTIMR